jgi:hypothetical protein
MHENELKSKPRRAQGGMGLLSRSIHVQSLHKSMAKIPNSREGRKGTVRERGAPGRRRGGVLLRQKERGRKEKVGEGVFNPLTLD